MAGIYIHIPFCYSVCAYCDFYKTTDLSAMPRFLEALFDEMQRRKKYLQGQIIQTVYLGGGTPSVCPPDVIRKILKKIDTLFVVEKDAEITMEANPDDLTPGYLKELSCTPVNRLSIGVQSFFDRDLEMMKRRHNGLQALQSVENAFGAGFDNLSIDLIYGLPGLARDRWLENLKRAFRLPVCHLSAYHITYHPGTLFYEWLKEGKWKETKEEESVHQYEMLVREAENHSFEQYEISNFAKQQRYARHNTAYWFHEPYLGLGPSAHSYNRKSRQWNVADLDAYIHSFHAGSGVSESEILTANDRFNEYILTRIRTKWGFSQAEVIARFGVEKWNFLTKKMKPYLIQGVVKEEKGIYRLTHEGMFISDQIMEALYFTEP
jgi:oxygen-independent coproporphyrinogen III oxidase